VSASSASASVNKERMPCRLTPGRVFGNEAAFLECRRLLLSVKLFIRILDPVLKVFAGFPVQAIPKSSGPELSSQPVPRR